MSEKDNGNESDPADLGGIWNELKGGVSQRLNHPFFGWLLPSFALWNWPAFVTLFAATSPIDARIQDVQRMLGESAWNYWGPLGVALVAAPVGRVLSAATIWLLARANWVWEKAVRHKFGSDAKLRTVEEKMEQLRIEASQVGQLRRQITALNEELRSNKQKTGEASREKVQLVKQIKELTKEKEDANQKALNVQMEHEIVRMKLSEDLVRTRVALFELYQFAHGTTRANEDRLLSRAIVDKWASASAVQPIMEQVFNQVKQPHATGIPKLG
jgi:hypothetical protein